MRSAIIAAVPWKTARLVYLVLWPLGLALGVVGLGLDATGYWGAHGFLLNLVSALTGFCFGVPVVVSLLKRVTDRIEAEKAHDLAERRRLEQIERQEIDEQKRDIYRRREAVRAQEAVTHERAQRLGEELRQVRETVERIAVLAQGRSSRLGLEMGQLNIDREMLQLVGRLQERLASDLPARID